jgi:hypothetical protein
VGEIRTGKNSSHVRYVHVVLEQYKQYRNISFSHTCSSIFIKSTTNNNMAEEEAIINNQEYDDNEDNEQNQESSGGEDVYDPADGLNFFYERLPQYPQNTVEEILCGKFEQDIYEDEPIEAKKRAKMLKNGNTVVEILLLHTRARLGCLPYTPEQGRIPFNILFLIDEFQTYRICNFFPCRSRCL